MGLQILILTRTFFAKSWELSRCQLCRCSRHIFIVMTTARFSFTNRWRPPWRRHAYINPWLTSEDTTESRATAATEVSQHLLKWLKTGKNLSIRIVIGALFMELSKAFDSLPHGLLITKFRAYGLSLSAYDLLSSYLCNRHQRVKIKGGRSEWREVKKEYPRAQFLAPCFLIYSLMISIFQFQITLLSPNIHFP